MGVCVGVSDVRVKASELGAKEVGEREGGKHAGEASKRARDKGVFISQLHPIVV